MKVIKWLANAAIGTVIIIVTLYLAISVCIAFFKLSGQLIEGGRMIFDLRTPSWSGLVAFQAICGAVIALGFLLRRKLRQASPTP